MVRIRAIDLRGHADSEHGAATSYTYARYAADLAEALERLDLRDFLLLGHSMGGMCSLHYAAAHPERIGRLIIRSERRARINPASFAEVKARCPQAERAEVAGSDHHITLDNPQGFVDIVRAWLASQR